MHSFTPDFMIIHKNTDNILISEKSVVTVGSFDGVHIGHRKILSRLTEISNEIQGCSVVITFFPHPRHVLSHSGSPLFLLNTLEEKAARLAEAGIDHLVLVNFNERFSEMSPEDYIEHFLIAKFHPHTLVIGHDHRYGKERKGGFELMEQYAYHGHFKLEEIPAHELKEATISSTLIRTKILEGDIDVANQLLGYPYLFSGLVIEGNKLGRTIGFPTVNIKINDTTKLIPGFGVYTVIVKLDDGFEYGGMMHLGNRPSINDNSRSIEVHILGFDGDLYGQEITVMMKGKLREIISFSDLGELKTQLSLDREMTVRYFSDAT
jgi:riboflavin kinase/FMN adenylyltransferase